MKSEFGDRAVDPQRKRRGRVGERTPPLVADRADRTSDDGLQRLDDLFVGVRLTPHVRSPAGVVKNRRREPPARAAIDARPIDEYGTWGVGGKSQGGIGHSVLPRTHLAIRRRQGGGAALGHALLNNDGSPPVSLPEFGADGWPQAYLKA